MNWIRKCKGSVSIFLCLILLPMVTYSSMIIDASRLQSARVAISSAGDLAMNAALSEYETILEDMYGLFAVSKSDEELQEALRYYFKQTIESRFDSDETKGELNAKGISDSIVDMIFAGDDPNVDFSNLIQLQIEDADFTYSSVQGAALANPAVMKRQIIDYMKYKGPISLVSTLFSKLSFLKDSAKQTEVLEKKVEYTEKLSDLKDPCERAYYGIVGKDNDDGGHSTGSNEWIKDYNETLDKQSVQAALTESERYYRMMTACNIMYKYRPFENKLDYDAVLQMAKDSGYTIDTDNSGGESTYAWLCNQWESSVGDCESKLDAVRDKYNTIVNVYSGNGTFSSIADRLSITETSGNNYSASLAYIEGNVLSYQDIKSGGANRNGLENNISDVKNYSTTNDALKKRFDIQKNSDFEMENLKKVVAYCYNLEKLKGIYDSTFDKYKSLVKEDFEAEVQQEIEEKEAAKSEEDDEEEEDDYEIKSADDRLQEALDDSGSGIGSRYCIQKRMGAVNYSILGDYRNQLKSFITLLTDCSIYDTMGQKYASEAHSFLVKYYDRLIYMKDQLNLVSSALTDVHSKAKEVQEAKTNWENSIGDVKSESTKASLQSDCDTTTEAFELESVEALQEVVNTCRDKAVDLIEQLKTVTYMGNVVVYPTTNGDYSTNFKNHSLLEGLTVNSGNDAFDLSNQTDKFIYDTSGIKPEEFVKFKEIDGEPDEEKFFKTLESICHPKGKKEMTTDQQNQKNNIEGNIKTDGDGKVEVGDPKDAPEKENKEPEKENEIKADIGKIWDEINNYCKTHIEREESYNDAGVDETENGNVSGVGIPSSEDDAKGKNPSEPLKQAQKILKQIGNLAATVRDTAYLEEYFTEMFTCQTDAIKDEGTLQMLNGFTNSSKADRALNTNTEWYGNEIEYIIWGDNNMQNNRTKNEALIYVIRFALNAIYAFTAPDIQSFALEVATAIAGWTVIGVPIVQACITVAIALAESAWDLYLLKDGKDVAIYKNATTFVCSPTGALKAVTEQIVNDAVEKAKNTIEDKLDEIADAANNAVDEYGNKAYSTIKDAATSVTGYVDAYINEQAETIKSTIKSQLVSPIINKITPIMTQLNKSASNTEETIKELVEKSIEDAFSAARSSIDDNIENGIAKEVLNELLSEGNSHFQIYKNELITQLTTYFKQVEDATDTNKLSEKINGIIDEWVDKFKDVILDKLQPIKDSIMEQVEKCEEPIGNLKDFMHEQINQASDKINGTALQFVDDVGNGINQTVSSTIDRFKGDEVIDTASSGGFTLNYKEYCKIFVLLKIPFSEETMLKRAAVLIQLNVQNAVKNKNDKFEMVKANTLVSINAKVKLGTLFPWPVKDEQNAAGGESNVTLDFSNLGTNIVDISYNGINGY